MQQSTSGTPQQYPNQQMIIRPNMPPQQQISQTPLHQQPHFMQQQHISVQQQNGVIPQAQVNSHLNHQNQTAPPNVTVSAQNGHMAQSNTSMVLNFIFVNVRL